MAAEKELKRKLVAEKQKAKRKVPSTRKRNHTQKKVVVDALSPSSSSSDEVMKNEMDSNFQLHTSDELNESYSSDDCTNLALIAKEQKLVNSNICYYCGGDYESSRPNERKWSKCSGSCNLWSHEACLDSEKSPVWFCEVCNNEN